MAKRRPTNRERGRRKIESRAHSIICPKCGQKVPDAELEWHLSEVHGSLSVFLSERKRDLVILMAIVAILVIVAYIMTTMPFEDENPPSSPSSNWLDSYKPEHKTGSSENDWWTAYPDINPAPGSPVDHPSWVEDILDDGPLIILDHSEGCAPCVAQTGDIEAIKKNYQGQITYLDLLSSGDDPRAFEAFNAYDPNGDPPYIPLTIIITRVKDGSGTRIVWHSTEGATGQDWIEGYVKDAIYYYDESQG